MQKKQKKPQTIVIALHKKHVCLALFFLADLVMSAKTIKCTVFLFFPVL